MSCTTPPALSIRVPVCPRLKRHPVVFRTRSVHPRLHCSYFSLRKSYRGVARVRISAASTEVSSRKLLAQRKDRPIRSGSRGPFRGATHERRVCVHRGHGRPYGVACCGRQTVQQQQPAAATAAASLPKVFRSHHTPL